MFDGADDWKALMGGMKEWDKIKKEEQKIAHGKPVGASDGRLRAMAMHYWQSLRRQPLPDPVTGEVEVDSFHADLMFRLGLSNLDRDRFSLILKEVMQ